MNFIKCHKCGREEPSFDYAHVCGHVEIKSKMNKRIRELAEQAMEPTGVEGLGGSYMELNREKFAELIVRESAKIAAQDPLFLNYAENDKHMERDIINHSFKKIKKEFGID